MGNEEDRFIINEYEREFATAESDAILTLYVRAGEIFLLPENITKENAIVVLAKALFTVTMMDGWRR